MSTEQSPSNPPPSTDGVDFETLRQMLTPQRRARIDHSVRHRHKSLTVVVEDIRDPHNQGAVLRTAEGLGLLSAHSIDTADDTFRPARGITRDSDKWMRVHRHTSIESCVEQLASEGYAIYCGALDATSVSLYDLDVTRPCAFVFGNEHKGISPTLRAHATRLFTIPMRGFVESFNISVAAAICLSHAIHQRSLAGMETDLSEAEREALREEYERKSLGKRLLRAAGQLPPRHADVIPHGGSDFESPEPDAVTNGGQD
jgi:tRNA (guanosine-2'-O-)-methyltransferase